MYGYVNSYMHTWMHTHMLNPYTYVSTHTHTHISEPHGSTYALLNTQRPASAPQRTKSALLAASGYACSSAVTTSGPARFIKAKCSGSLFSCKRGAKEQRQHATQTGRQAHWCFYPSCLRHVSICVRMNHRICMYLNVCTKSLRLCLFLSICLCLCVWVCV